MLFCQSNYIHTCQNVADSPESFTKNELPIGSLCAFINELYDIHGASALHTLMKRTNLLWMDNCFFFLKKSIKLQRWQIYRTNVQLCTLVCVRRIMTYARHCQDGFVWIVKTQKWFSCFQSHMSRLTNEVV